MNVEDGGARLGRASIDAILENQAAGGAFVASPDFSQYSYCWLRDGSFTAYAMDRVGEHGASAAYHDWVASALGGIAGSMEVAVEMRRADKVVDPGLLPPARFALDGSTVADDWPNFQIDGYGTWLWSLREHLGLACDRVMSAPLRQVVERTARYLDAFALEPCFDVWEMNGTEVHTSTVASVYAGLTAAAALLGDRSLETRAEEVRAHVRAAGVGAGRYEKSNAAHEVEASTLWLSRPFGLVEEGDLVFERTVHAIESELRFEGGIRRFPDDTYFGGGAWPVLTASLGWHYASVGRGADALGCLEWIERHFDARDELGEQFGGERRDRAMYDEWVGRWGLPAKRLLWSHAMHLVLRAELGITTGIANS
jgi:GH15 family glucan-1,4-alpha-glucosidase